VYVYLCLKDIRVAIFGRFGRFDIFFKESSRTARAPTRYAINYDNNLPNVSKVTKKTKQIRTIIARNYF